VKKKKVYGKNPKTEVRGELPTLIKPEGRVRRLTNSFKNMAFKGRYEER
jgi:hypothetical protein